MNYQTGTGTGTGTGIREQPPPSSSASSRGSPLFSNSRAFGRARARGRSSTREFGRSRRHARSPRNRRPPPPPRTERDRRCRFRLGNTAARYHSLVLDRSRARALASKHPRPTRSQLGTSRSLARWCPHSARALHSKARSRSHNPALRTRLGPRQSRGSARSHCPNPRCPRPRRPRRRCLRRDSKCPRRLPHLRHRPQSSCRNSRARSERTTRSSDSPREATEGLQRREARRLGLLLVYGHIGAKCQAQVRDALQRRAFERWTPGFESRH